MNKNDNDVTVVDGKEPLEKLPTTTGTPRVVVQQCASRGRVDLLEIDKPNNNEEQTTNSEMAKQLHLLTITRQSAGLPVNDLRNGNRPLDDNNKNENASAPSRVSLSERSLITTLEPFSHQDERRNYSRKTQRSTKRKEQMVREAMLENSSSTPTFPRFFNLKFPGVNIETDLDNISAQRDIIKQIGQCDGNIKKQNRDTLLIKVKSKQQGDRLRQVTSIAGVETEVSEHKSLNQSKGTVFSKTMSNTPVDVLREALRDQGVVEIERMKTKVNGTLQESHRYIITFDRPDPPGAIKIVDWHHELIELYIPKPMRCVKCWRLGHTQKRCRRQHLVCAQCGEEGHQARTCNKEAKCVNCQGSHRSMDWDCPAYFFKSEVLATQVRMKYGYKEAEEDVKQRFQASGRQHTFPRFRPAIPTEPGLPLSTAQPPVSSRELSQRLEETQTNRDRHNSQPTTIDMDNDCSEPTGQPSEQMIAEASSDIPDAAGAPENALRELQVSETEEEEEKSMKKKTDRLENSKPSPSDDEEAGEDQQPRDEQEDHINNKTKPSKCVVPIEPSFWSVLEAGQTQKAESTASKNLKNKEGAIPKTRVTHETGTDTYHQPCDGINSPNILDIPLPDSPKTTKRREAKLSDGIASTQEEAHHYDPWEDSFLVGPNITPSRPPPGIVADRVGKIQDPSLSHLKTATQYFKNRKSPPEKLSRRQEKRKRKSLEKAQKKEQKEAEKTQNIPVIGSEAWAAHKKHKS